jgi:GH24 family phage-related lysozyme (muramidase)
MTYIPAPQPLISDAALNLIVTEEDGSADYYAKHYTHFDWPGGVSGPTIGVGYDCGYSTPAEAKADWADYIDATMLAAVIEACGRKGSSAQQWVVANRNRVTVPFAVGLSQFKAKSLPKWDTMLRAALPNYDLLPLDCRGALLSLAYNRGCSFDLPGSRALEMRNIKAEMIAKNFAAIPAQFLSMRRLWPPQGSDLWNRRGHEAALFQSGLATLTKAVS